MFSSKGTVRYEERGQGYRDVEKVGKHWFRARLTLHNVPYPYYGQTKTTYFNRLF